MTRPPTRSPLQASQPDALDDLEELGDDAIIAQQTEAHAPRPRATVSEESRSVVITDHPLRRDTEPPRGTGFPVRAAAEPTLVIRDRRALDELRRDIVQRQAKKRRGNRALYMWGGLGLVAFVLGGIVAFLATDSHSDAAQADNSQSGRVEGQVANSHASDVVPIAKPTAAAAEAPRAVRLDDLPVEPKHKH
ncbi:MAG TPA: hypothetical protein VHW01_05580 [Polyangiaceae bacterium]|nr:hypothetical protein [Polyangiaceae bacterium]